ncbi:DNA translocase FtsK [Acidisphaera sp. L21]|uniref:DNA translocase FtsK n=1 Tax=Acidisphaera sp. L21 TaxID=1641851 RepID=UPI00131C6A37|nr:DNA translocase FtsK [Acidisphaera sp. L21]
MSAAVPARRLASPAIRTLISRRLSELGGIVLGLGGVALLVALACYNPLDPSMNTATSRPPTNLAGPAGAMAADLLLQSLGVAAVLPGVVALAWAWRIASHRGLGSFAARLASTLAALPVLAALAAALPTQAAWPSDAGPGGAIGRVIAQSVTSYAHGLLGPLGVMIALAVGGVLGVVLFWAALGLSAGEWRAAGRVAGGSLARGHKVGRGAVGLLPLLMAPLRLLRRREPEPLRPLEPMLRAASRPAPARRANPPPMGEPQREFQGERQEEAERHDEHEAEQVEEEETTLPRTQMAVAAPAPRTRISLPTRKTAPTHQPSLPLPEAAPGNWRMPPLSLLKAAPVRANTGPSEEALQANARLLESVLDEYGVQGTIREIRPGPVVTLYELEPAPGIRSARVIGLADDVARSMSVTAVRIATVPGRNVIGIEVPNAKRETVYLSELLGSDAWEKHPGRLALALGKDIGGEPILADLARMPHLLVAGTTGSGKSVGINAMILSLLYRLSPDQCRLILIDPKMLELSVYDGIPHLMAPVVTEPAKAVTALKWTVREMERRYRAMSQLGVRNVGGYNERVEEASARGEVVTRRVQTGFDAETGKPIFEEHPLALEKLPFLVVVIDEMADLMMVAGKEIEAAVQRLAQMARAAGIHVVMATQRPSVDVITGTIKANFPTRISFTVISKFDSRTILGEQGSEQLLGQGDMLYMQGGGRIGRVHGPFVSDREVEDVVAFLRAQGEPSYLDEVTEAPDEDEGGSAMSGIAGGSDGEKSLFDQAVAVVAREGKASTSFIQRHLSIGYNRAAKLIEQMEKEGIISPANHVGKREILVRRTHDED